MTECIFKWAKEEDVMIGVNTPGKIADDVWSAFLDDFAASDYRVYIGCTLGILEVSSTQRKQAAVALRENGVSVVVITDEVLVRGVVTAVSWLGADVKSFPWRDFARGLKHARLVERQDQLTARVDVLRDKVRRLEQEQRQRRREQMRQVN